MDKVFLKVVAGVLLIISSLELCLNANYIIAGIFTIGAGIAYHYSNTSKKRRVI